MPEYLILQYNTVKYYYSMCAIYNIITVLLYTNYNNWVSKMQLHKTQLYNKLALEHRLNNILNVNIFYLTYLKAL